MIADTVFVIFVLLEFTPVDPGDSVFWAYHGESLHCVLCTLTVEIQAKVVNKFLQFIVLNFRLFFFSQLLKVFISLYPP